jgi:indolepyruvate ferredoxin oxidoreductase beta subunit
MKTGKQEFNMIINGVGGQGLITLLKIISEAALVEGKDIRTSELHGLSQRGGSVEVYIRFGKKIWSPLVEKGKADLILSL